MCRECHRRAQHPAPGEDSNPGVQPCLVIAPKPFAVGTVNGLPKKMKDFLSNQRAFTLLELIAVMLIMGLLAAEAVPRYMDLEANASNRAIDAAVSELNGREALIWGQVKTTATAYTRATGDNDVWGLMLNDATNTYPYLGAEYRWAVLPDQSGGSLTFKNGNAFSLSRSPSTIAVPGHWRRVR